MKQRFAVDYTKILGFQEKINQKKKKAEKECKKISNGNTEMADRQHNLIMEKDEKIKEEN